MGRSFPLFSVVLVAYMVPYTDLCEQNGGWGENRLYARRSWLIRWFHGYLDVQVRIRLNVQRAERKAAVDHYVDACLVLPSHMAT